MPCSSFTPYKVYWPGLYFVALYFTRSVQCAVIRELQWAAALKTVRLTSTSSALRWPAVPSWSISRCSVRTALTLLLDQWYVTPMLKEFIDLEIH